MKLIIQTKPEASYERVVVKVVMTEYRHILSGAWMQLNKDFQQSRFTPNQEADIQCYLYHLCLKKLGDPTKIHAEWRTTDGGFLDLMLGPGKLPVEIKWSYIRARKKPSGRWSKDIKKLANEFSSRKPTFALFLSNEKCEPIPESQLSEQHKKSLLAISGAAKKHNVDLLLPYELG